LHKELHTLAATCEGISATVKRANWSLDTILLANHISAMVVSKTEHCTRRRSCTNPNGWITENSWAPNMARKSQLGTTGRLRDYDHSNTQMLAEKTS